MTLKIPAGVLAQHVIAPTKVRRAFGQAPAWREATATDMAYAAGFFDGEGNVVIAANKSGGAAERYLVYNMRIGASQNDPAPLFWLRERWGGSVRKMGKRAHIWQQFSKGALAFLIDVEPYLQIKRERALIAIDYQTRIIQRGRAGRTPEHVEWLAATKIRMNQLNAHPKNEHVS